MTSIPRVYSLVNNPITSLLAYEIAQLPSQPKVPQVVLLLNDMKKLSRFLENDSKLTIQKNNDTDYHHSQFMASHLPPVYSTGEVATIPNAIFSGPHVKGLVQSIQKYKKSLNDRSNVLLVNPPVGVIENLYMNVWQTKESRPNLLIGITARKERSVAVSVNEFHINVKKPKLRLRISPVPKDLFHYNEDLQSDEIRNMRERNDLVKLLESTTENKSGVLSLDLLFYPYGELLLIRLEKLIIESCIEPLAALYGCRYRHELFKIEHAKNLIMDMIKEQVWILRCAYPFLANIPNVKTALDYDRLYSVVLRELEQGGNKFTRMLYEIDQLQGTNISELTGFFMRIANYRKIDCKLNNTITNLVMGKAALARQKTFDYKYL